MLLVQLFLGAGLEQAFVDRPGAFEFRLFQNVADALEAGRERFEIRRGTQILYVREARFQVNQIAPAGGHAGIHFVIGEAAVILEVELHAVGEEIDERLVAFEEVEQRQLDFAFHQNLYDALRRAPQREGIARAGGNHAHAETAAQRVELVGQRHQLRRPIARNAIFHALGLVLVVDGLPHGLVSPWKRAYRPPTTP